MGVEDWASRATGETVLQAAVRRLAKLPASPTRPGLAAVPLPFASRAAIKRWHDNDEVNAAIDAAPIKKVPIEGLHAIQHSVVPKVVLAYLKDPDKLPKGADAKCRDEEHGGPVDVPVVVVKGGKCYLWDGHHRATAAILRGEDSIRARVADLDAEEERASAA